MPTVFPVCPGSHENENTLRTNTRVLPAFFEHHRKCHFFSLWFPPPINPPPTYQFSMTTSNTNVGAFGPELRGSNITLESIFKPSDASTRQTKIICTLGPACWQVPQLEGLIGAGLCVARFNFSHGDHATHQACLDRLREAAKNQKKHIGALCVCRH